MVSGDAISGSRGTKGFIKSRNRTGQVSNGTKVQRIVANDDDEGDGLTARHDCDELWTTNLSEKKKRK